MPKKCCIPNCRFQSNDRQGSDLSYYKIPADECTKTLWIQNITKHFDIKLNKWSYVCGLHFEPSSVKLTEKRAWIKKRCAPTIFAPTREKYINIKESEGYIVKNISNRDMKVNNKSTTYPLSIKNYIVDVLQSYDNKTSCTENYNYSNELDIANKKIEEYNKSSVTSGRAKKSIISMDIDTLLNDVTDKGKRKLHDAFKKAQAEVTTLRKKLKNNRMRTFRAKKKFNNASSLIAHMKNKKLISEQVS